jgi:hypothetical protein
MSNLMNERYYEKYAWVFFLIVISLTAFRQKQKWAWYAFCFVPAYFLAWIVLSSTLPAQLQSALVPPLIVTIILSVAGLLLPFRTFFSKRNK